jgi:hypothetical protein
MLKSLPAMPSRGIKLFQDPTSTEFVEGRCRSLTSYLGALCIFPRMTSIPDFTEVVLVLSCTLVL